jgi:hypothetical protein
VLLAAGAVYQYFIKRNKPDIGYVIQLIVYSAIIGNGLIWMLKGFTFAVFGSSKLGDISSEDIRGLAFIGSATGICLISYFFIRFLRRKDSEKN